MRFIKGPALCRAFDIKSLRGDRLLYLIGTGTDYFRPGLLGRLDRHRVTIMTKTINKGRKMGRTDVPADSVSKSMIISGSWKAPRRFICWVTARVSLLQAFGDVQGLMQQ